MGHRMAIELNGGKPATVLPRSSDLLTPESVDVRRRNHGTDGRFVRGNSAGTGKGWRSFIRRSLGTDATTPVVERLFRESWTLHSAFLRELPFVGAQVTALSAARARWTALSSYYSNRAAELGLDTDAGRAALELAMRLDQRAERLCVTALDVATRLAVAARRAPSGAIPPWFVVDDSPPAPADGESESTGGDSDGGKSA